MQWDADIALKLGKQLEAYIFDLADNHMFFKQTESLERCHVDELACYDEGANLAKYDFNMDHLGRNKGLSDLEPAALIPLAYRYRHIRNLYRANSLQDFLGPKTKDLLDTVVTIDNLSGKWLSAAREALSKVPLHEGAINICLSSGQLTPTLVKLIIFNLQGFFPVRNVYSSKGAGKTAIMKQIMQRFGPGGSTAERFHYRMVGNGPEEEATAKELMKEFCTRKGVAADSIHEHESLVSFAKVTCPGDLAKAVHVPPLNAS